MCQLSWIESTHHQELIPFALNLKIFGLAQSCQGVHQDYSTWSIQLGVHSRWCLKLVMTILNML
jgi:hypothetical protein